QEINCLKSYATKTELELPHKIPGPVGQNGSGKSNIGDAVRWVLGEQSAKQLRGSRMEDVIFSGTENRRPMGFAYVAILFDNADRKIALDFDEVKVARRVYRSGESEYLLNGSACRRRDIVEIFY
ncbi:MAG: AAA family ATPase, partial [Clostridiales bacterium]|nr:AAA family ATPase [Clostridiales bacterium]